MDDPLKSHCHSRAWVGFLFFQLLLPSGARNATSRFPWNTDGCATTGSMKFGGSKLTCWHSAFIETVVPHFKEVGSDLAQVDVQSCYPSTKVNLDATMFATNSRLREIRINNCNIVNIAPRTFEKQDLLQIDLSRNAIASISNETFAGLKNLMVVYLENNAIQIIEKGTFAGHDILAGINVGNNGLRTLETGSFSGLGKLEQLTLEGNDIGTVWNGIFEGLESLQELYLGTNKFLVLQNDSFTGALGVKRLELTGNKDLLSFSSGRFLSGLRNLTWLDLTGVDLSKKNAESTDLNLPGFFKDQRDSLTKLILTGTNFNNDLMPMIQGLNNLKMLDIEDNSVGYLLEATLPTVINGSINLKDNEIMYVGEGSFARMQGTSVDLDGNPFYCSCSLVWFGEYLRSKEGATVANIDNLLCGGPMKWYRTKVKVFNPFWWKCSPYVPYVALAFVIGFALLLTLVVTIVWCNLVNLRHWLLERREVSRRNEQEERREEVDPERRPLDHAISGMSSLPKGKTCAFICYDMHDPLVLSWVNQYIEDKLYNHPLRISLQWSAGDGFIPIWKQVKDYGFGVQSFLVIATEDFITKFWPAISEKSGYENIAKFVLVLMRHKKKDMPNDLRRLRCPTFEWPERKSCCTTLGRKRTHFWKQVRLTLKGIPD